MAVHALFADSAGALVIEGNLSNLHVAHYATIGEGHEVKQAFRHKVGLEVPDPLLNMEMERENNGTLLVHAEGLFGWEAHRLLVDANGVQVWDLGNLGPPSEGPVHQNASEGLVATGEQV